MGQIPNLSGKNMVLAPRIDVFTHLPECVSRSALSWHMIAIHRGKWMTLLGEELDGLGGDRI